MDTFTTVLSVFSTVCAIVFGYIAFVRNRDKDKESNVKHDATVLTEIGYIKANTDEIKAEQKEQRKTNTEFVTRLTDVEASAKQAHKRLDHIEHRGHPSPPKIAVFDIRYTEGRTKPALRA